MSAEEEVARLRDELTQARLDLANSDAIREEFVKQSVALAGDMARALSAVEAAFYAGFRHGRNYSCDGDAAYRMWCEDLKQS